MSQFLNASDAARRLGISAKALRLYEQRGLLAPVRSAAGWRAYGPADLERAAEIVALRALGFSLAQVARILKGDASGLEPALAGHEAALEARLREVVAALEGVRAMRGDLARGGAPTVSDLTRTLVPTPGLHVAFELPWPWGGEPFELRDIRPLTYITGPLGSGKTRLAMRLAEAGVAFDYEHVPGVVHGCLRMNRRLRPARDMIRSAGRFLKERLQTTNVGGKQS